MVMGVVIVDVVAYRGGNIRLKGEVGQSINKVIIVMLLGINWGIRFYKVLCFKPHINILINILDLKVPLDYSL